MPFSRSVVSGIFENSIAQAYEKIISLAQHFIWIENQFFISGMDGDNVINNRVVDALYQRICKAKKRKEHFKVYIFLPLLPSFQGSIKADSAGGFRSIMHWQYRTICRGEDSLKSMLAENGIEMDDYVAFFFFAPTSPFQRHDCRLAVLK